MRTTRSLQPQQGAALIISLMLLVLLSLSSVAGIKASLSQERMAGNRKAGNDSFQAAETGLRLAETALIAAPHLVAASCAAEPCDLEDEALDIDHLASPGSGWIAVTSGRDTNGMSVWYRITSLGRTLAPVNSRSQAPGELYRIVAVSFRGTNRTVLEAIHVLTVI